MTSETSKASATTNAHRRGSAPRFDVAIIGGLGRVGLPLALVLADAGLHVAIVDPDTRKRASVHQGRMPFREADAEPLLRRTLGRTLTLADDLGVVADSGVIIVTIGTPLDEHLHPRLGPMLDLAEGLVPHLRDGHILILRSTVYPGTTRVLQDFFRRQGRSVEVAYCPERIAEGKAIQELRRLPQIVSGFTPECLRGAESLFKSLGVEIVRVPVAEAELAKLFLNAWRYIEFATANQFYMFATLLGGDYERIYHAMTHNYPRARNLARPGFAAGPCLLKDTMQLSASYGNHFPLGHAAMLINEGLPQFIVDQLRRSRGGSIEGVPVGILGMAFKADIDDARDSLSYRLRKLLRFHGALPVCSDEFVEDPSFVSKEDVLGSCPVVVIGVPHTAYRGLQVPPGTQVVDLWGCSSPAPGAEGAPTGRHGIPSGTTGDSRGRASRELTR